MQKRMSREEQKIRKGFSSDGDFQVSFLFIVHTLPVSVAWENILSPILW